jgi:hypothetical protein
MRRPSERGTPPAEKAQLPHVVSCKINAPLSPASLSNHSLFFSSRFFPFLLVILTSSFSVVLFVRCPLCAWTRELHAHAL